MFVDYYSLLGVSPHVTKEDIKRAFRAKAKTSHPDVGGTHEDFLLLKEAYDVLSNEFQRKIYDEVYWKYYQMHDSNANNQKQNADENQQNVNQDDTNQSEYGPTKQSVSNIEDNIYNYKVDSVPKINLSRFGANGMKGFIFVGLSFIIIGAVIGINAVVTTESESEMASSNLQTSTLNASDGNSSLNQKNSLNNISSSSNTVNHQPNTVQIPLKQGESIVQDTQITNSKATEIKLSYFIHKYIYLSVEALNNHDFSIVEPHINPKGKKYQEQKKYMDTLRKKNITEKLLTVETRKISQVDDFLYKVETYEEYSINYGDGTTKLKSFISEYLVEVSDNGGFLVNELIKTNEIDSNKAKTTTPPNPNNSTVTKTSASHFTLGSSKEEVRSIMGAPSNLFTTFQGETWGYGLSEIEFNQDGKVIGWSDIEKTLKVSIGEAKPKVPPFTFGSQKREVVDAMGTPTTLRKTFAGETWGYDLSDVEFDQQGQVIGWSEIDTKLYVSIGNESPQATRFTMGSSLKEVVDAMGTPTRLQMTYSGVTLGYGLSSVEIDHNGFVTGWSNIEGNLKTQ